MVFSFRNAVLQRNGSLLIHKFNWEVNEGESWWICGGNGTGKTALLETLSGHHRLTSGEIILPEAVSEEKFFSSVTLIGRDFSIYRMFNRSAGFYQQRYFSPGVEETPPVIDFIISETGIAEDRIRSSACEFGFDELLDKHIISLSTGEGRRILLLILWLTDRKIICFDDPYAGLDAGGKEQVSHAIRTLIKKKVTVLVTGVELPPSGLVDHLLAIRDRRIVFSGEIHGFASVNPEPSFIPGDIHLKSYVHNGFDSEFSIVAEMKNLTIRYGEKTVQKDFSWKILRGEKWMLTGPNGSGKSTLLSLIYGDNPMAYTYDLVIFDRLRGTGESIWEIKSRMGYFSSELQQFFPRSLTLYEAVLTGYSDHLTVRHDLTPGHYRQADEIIEAAGLTDFRDVPLYSLSFSQCRIALVSRALVKFPPLVILDEPCQGLDRHAIKTVNRLVDAVCREEAKTLIYVTHQTETVPGIINRHLRLITG